MLPTHLSSKFQQNALAKSASKNTLAKKTPALGPALLESSLLLLITYKAIKAKVITFSRVKNAYVRFQ